MDQHVFWLAFLLSVMAYAASAIEPFATQSTCERECGNITIPYPFGLGNSSECSVDENFQLDCNQTSLLLGNIPVVSLSLRDGTAVIQLFVASYCNGRTNAPSVTLGRSSMRFSTTGNKFTAIGCNTIAKISDGGDTTGRFASGCLSMCRPNTPMKSLKQLTTETTSCSGAGCCQTPIPPGLKTLNVSLDIYEVNSSEENTCSYGFLSGSNFTIRESPEGLLRSDVLMDWAVGEMTCQEAKNNGTKYICGQNTNCIDSTNGLGYRCLCKDGYQFGNPYNKTGCIDIDECSPENGDSYSCKGTCRNTQGNYTCHCSFGYSGDGKFGCDLKASILVAIGIGVVVFLVGFSFSIFWLYKRKVQQMNHRKNGGFLLDTLTVKSFREAQLEKATNGFDSVQLLGEGGNGWVYRGSVNNTDIAIKKSKIVDEDQIEQFLNEADVVSKINHKNVVKLLGVCLDSKVPMLVYEYVSNGTLYQHIHGKHSRILDSWRICLRIVAETARALEYMHSLADPPIIHRDIKTSNILLDGTYTAKVADFGASKLIPLDRTMAPTRGQGTMGYLDPEYLQTGELTTMSDVYGFGVVLMELLSKQKPLTRGGSGEMISLVKVFTVAVDSNKFDQVVKVAHATEREAEQVHLVAKLAIQCVAMPSKKRPTMIEVADVLNGLSKEYHSFPVVGSGDETINLLDDQDVMTTSVDFELSIY